MGECLYKYPCSDKTYLVKSWEFKFNDAEKKKKREKLLPVNYKKRNA